MRLSDDQSSLKNGVKKGSAALQEDEGTSYQKGKGKKRTLQAVE
jgi:hypothetical protein